VPGVRVAGGAGVGTLAADGVTAPPARVINGSAFEIEASAGGEAGRVEPAGTCVAEALLFGAGSGVMSPSLGRAPMIGTGPWAIACSLDQM
jgi:hypothetical protein